LLGRGRAVAPFFSFYLVYKDKIEVRPFFNLLAGRQLFRPVQDGILPNFRCFPDGNSFSNYCHKSPRLVISVSCCTYPPHSNTIPAQRSQVQVRTTYPLLLVSSDSGSVTPLSDLIHAPAIFRFSPPLAFFSPAHPGLA